jgi:hypothetical protein
MPREHLCDFELAILVSGAGTQEMRGVFSDHLGACVPCREAVAFAVRSERGGSRAKACAAGEPRASAGINPAALTRLVRAFEDRFSGPNERLRPIAPALAFSPYDPSWLDGANRFLQRDASASPAGEPLPVLANADLSVLVRFRRVGEAFRAHVVTARAQPVGTHRLCFRGRALIFVVGSNGEVDLPGVTREDLASAEIVVEREPESRIESARGS